MVNLSYNINTAMEVAKEEGREEGIGIGREEGIGIGREEGIGIGREEGIGIGREEGREEEKAAIALMMKKNGVSEEEIAKYTKLSLEKIRAL